jgi:hypothetical protein
MKTKYCQNPDCNWDASHAVRLKSGRLLHLCTQCLAAFEMGKREGPDRQTVKIEVFRGCASVKSCPKGIEVVINDLDEKDHQ